MRIAFQGKKAVLFINDQKPPSFIVTKMVGTSKKGSIAKENNGWPMCLKTMRYAVHVIFEIM